MDFGRNETWRAFFHQKTTDTVRGSRPNDRNIRHRAVRDPGLLAVQEPAAVLEDGPHLHSSGVGAKTWLGQSEAAHHRSGLQPGKPVGLLLLRAKGEDRIHDERALDGDEAAEAGIGAFQFLHDEAVFHVAQTGASVTLQIRSQEAQPPDLRDQFCREAALAVTAADNGNYTILDKLAGRLADQSLLLA